jgi:predicted nucleic acid-binding protein
MMLYLDASALVKRYVAETGTQEVNHLFAQAAAIGTSLITYAEVAAAFGKAARVSLLPRDGALAALQVFRTQWTSLVRLSVTDGVVSRAGALAWEHNLRGYDAVHLASALSWKQTTGESVTLAAFDRQLWQAAKTAGLEIWPRDLAPFLGA